MAGIQTAELDLWFDLPYDPESSHAVNSVIDIAQCLSLVNRRFYRQGFQYAVAGLEVVSDVTTLTKVSRIPESWPIANAWVKAFSRWNESRDQVLDDEPSIESKYADFKVFLEANHQAAGFTANLIPDGFLSGGYGLDESYEWAAVEIEIPNDPVPGATAAYNLHMLGDTMPNSKGIVHGYAMSRARPQQEEPNVPQPAGWMTELFDVGDNLDEIRQDIADENDEPPYVVGTQQGVNVNQEFYPGGMHGGLQVETHMITRAGTALAQSFAPSFTAPCGLVQVQNSWTGDTPPLRYQFRMTLLAGDYKGVMARAMQEMND